MRQAVGKAVSAGAIIFASGCYERSAKAAEDEATRLFSQGFLEAGMPDFIADAATARAVPMDAGNTDESGVAPQAPTGTLSFLFTGGAMMVDKVDITGPQEINFPYEAKWSSSQGILTLSEIPLNRVVIGEVHPRSGGESLRFAITLTHAGEFEYTVTPAQVNGEIHFITK